ncbi:hypothetical protein TNCV_2645661 [Trichonephila clavipes]|nr:hypothetical protein TNCV_2645661 [Trichonephila clavipes]
MNFRHTSVAPLDIHEEFRSVPEQKSHEKRIKERGSESPRLLLDVILHTKIVFGNQRFYKNDIDQLWENYTRAFGDGPRHFEQWSSDEDDTSAVAPSPNYHIPPTGGRLSSRHLMRISPLYGVDCVVKQFLLKRKVIHCGGSIRRPQLSPQMTPHLLSKEHSKTD